MNKANQQGQDKHNRKDVMSTDTKEKIQQLENLLLSEDLEELNNATANFNILNALKLQNNEIRHSNFLDWIMSPFETHGFYSFFNPLYLKKIINNCVGYLIFRFKFCHKDASFMPLLCHNRTRKSIYFFVSLVFPPTYIFVLKASRNCHNSLLK